ncbi:hypothetical protein [Ruegeria sp. HKCCD7318]|nr:hypothetical protein [Ruegeria sp. HKCCD7318]
MTFLPGLLFDDTIMSQHAQTLSEKESVAIVKSKVFRPTLSFSLHLSALAALNPTCPMPLFFTRDID